MIFDVYTCRTHGWQNSFHCQSCHDTGHAGGHLDDPNECGWCDARSRIQVPIFPWPDLKAP